VRELKMDWIFIGGRLSDEFSDTQITTTMEKYRRYLEVSICEYGISMDDIFAKGLKCEHCNINRDRKFYYYMYHPESKQIKVIGSACMKFLNNVEKKCRCCGIKYLYSALACPVCSEDRVNIGNEVKFSHVARIVNDKNASNNCMRSKYIKFCYAYVYGNVESNFAKYIIENTDIKRPEVTYDYLKYDRFENCSIYHIYLYSNRLNFIKGPIPDKLKEYIDGEIIYKCIVCKNVEINYKVVMNDYRSNDVDICDNCMNRKFKFNGGFVELESILFPRAIKSLTVGYFYANDDELADIIGSFYDLKRDIAICDNTDIKIIKDMKVDEIKMYTYILYEHDFEAQSRDRIKKIIGDNCDFCGGVKFPELIGYENIKFCKCEHAIYHKSLYS
jgi:uncharacterized OB-fold protein